MRLTILGSSASYAGPGQACAGYLVEGGGVRVLFDCGNGVIANLGRVCDPLTLDAVFVSHAHPDHICDIYALQSILRYAPQGPAAPLPMHVPRGAFDSLSCMLSERGRAELTAAFIPHEYESGATVMVGELAVTPVPVEHADDTFALIAEEGSARLCYTSDTQATSAVLSAATGASLLLAEATLPKEYQGRAPHLTASQAGAIARMAGVRSLVLTHLWPTNDRDVAAAEAAVEFNGPVHVASELDAYDI
ncbi:MAG: MBL fold metallo-hydrolase [Coriobacteriia bacterium]